MKTLQLTPGSGDNFYCENCLRDAVLVRAWRGQGHDALVMPLYLPVSMEYVQESILPGIFMGGINVYLQQKWSFFQKTPRWLDKFFDSRSMLKLAARQAGATDAGDLGETTLSMLRGEEGRQAKEINRLVDWLARHDRPEAVILSNALLSGLARRIKESLQIPVFCLLQDEDEFLDMMPEPYLSQSWDLIRKRKSDIELFLSVSRYYTAFMQERLHLEDSQIRTTPLGIVPGDFTPAPAPPETPTIGYLSRMCPEKGLDILVRAFIELKQDSRFATARLRIAGGSSPADKPFIEAQRRALLAGGIPEEDFEFLPGFKHNYRQAFLHSLSVLSVPEKRPPAYGLYVLESLACGVPVVQPNHGVFPEMKETINDGIDLFTPEDPHDLKEKLTAILPDRDHTHQQGLKGRQKVAETYNIEENSRSVMEIISTVTGH